MPHAAIMAPWIVASIALLALHIAVQGISVTLEFGSRWNAGPRDDNRRPQGQVAGRAERALRNYLETFPAFGILALLLIVAGRADGWGTMGAMIWFGARLVYLPLYLLGIPYLRSLVWIVGALGLTLMAARALV